MRAARDQTALVDLTGLTTTQLQTMRDNLVAAHAESLKSSYSIPNLSVGRQNSAAILEQLQDVLAALAAQSDTTGGVIVVQFEEPGDRE